ncbi:MAG: hypothetical protein ACR2HZ_00220 [Gemmatimonadaceae bacterium]
MDPTTVGCELEIEGAERLVWRRRSSNFAERSRHLVIAENLDKAIPYATSEHWFQLLQRERAAILYLAPPDVRMVEKAKYVSQGFDVVR